MTFNTLSEINMGPMSHLTKMARIRLLKLTLSADKQTITVNTLDNPHVIVARIKQHPTTLRISAEINASGDVSTKTIKQINKIVERIEVAVYHAPTHHIA